MGETLQRKLFEYLSDNTVTDYETTQENMKKALLYYIDTKQSEKDKHNMDMDLVK